MGISQSNRRRQDLGARPGRGRTSLVGVVTPPDDDTSEDAPPIVVYNPSEHSVVDVIAHVEAHPDERDVILQLERDGKARVSLIAALGG